MKPGDPTPGRGEGQTLGCFGRETRGPNPGREEGAAAPFSVAYKFETFETLKFETFETLKFETFVLFQTFQTFQT